MTAAELRKLAEEADTQAAELARQAAVLRQQAVELRRLAEVSGRSGLRPIGDKGTLGTAQMEAATASRGAKVSRANTRGQWPMQVALHKRNLSVPEWARAQKRPRISGTLEASVETARSWLKAHGRGGHRIPLEWAERIAAEFCDELGNTEVPAVDASWPCGIRRPPGDPSKP